MTLSSDSRKLRRLFFPYGLMILIMVIAGWCLRFYTYENHGEKLQEILESVPTEGVRDPGSTIQVGMTVENIYNFDEGLQTFDSDGWVWIIWSPEVERKMKERGMSAQDLFFFFNGVDDYDFSLVPDTLAPLGMPDGRYYQKYRYSGHFFVSNLNFRLYPFQTVNLPLIFELKNTPLLGEKRPLQLMLDQDHSGVGSYIDVGGYVREGYSFMSYLHRYRSSHGEPGLIDGVKRLFQARMEITYQKSLMASAIRLFLPLFVVMLLLLLSPLIPPTGWDVRLAIPPTTLLTMIFLQQSYEDWIPELPYLTFMDCVYNVCYLDSLLLFGVYLWSSIKYHLTSEKDRQRAINQIMAIDRYALGALILLSIFSLWVNWRAMSLPWH